MADGGCLPVATLITDPQGSILLANRVAREVFGNDLVGENLVEQLADLGYPRCTMVYALPCRRWNWSSFAISTNAVCAWNWLLCCLPKVILPSAGC